MKIRIHNPIYGVPVRILERSGFIYVGNSYRGNSVDLKTRIYKNTDDNASPILDGIRKFIRHFIRLC